ncbi:MAG: cbb3-type cytochrome c oxidase subunit 3 [Pseudomonadota bacterium]|nr:cbb3-type cytochrome c oxidase subunit 3 [Pseudomonadota bacterium]
MNPVKDAAATAALGWAPGLMTAAFLLFFVGWTLWAWWPSNRANMEAAARLPLDDGDAP